ncbi:uncharacterized protein LOC111437393 isoform X2 [Cucurbita moschata]|nr:uncharacterized protein LOC111437393 isoform X2 [Cucurbita moschata]
MSKERAKKPTFLTLTENQKLFLSLINEYAAEKMQGEKSVVVLRKRMEELRSELEAANADLENVKQTKETKETTEQELKGCEVELSLNETSIKTLETRISVLQGEIASVGSELDSLKCEGGAARNQFLDHMSELDEKIRKFQYQLDIKKTGIVPDGDATEESHELAGDDTKTSESVEDRLIKVITQITNEDDAYLLKEQMKNQNRQMSINLEKRKAAMAMMQKGTTKSGDLTSSGSEGSYNRLSETLLNSCICPQCFHDNSEAWDNIPQ